MAIAHSHRISYGLIVSYDWNQDVSPNISKKILAHRHGSIFINYNIKRNELIVLIKEYFVIFYGYFSSFL